MGETRDDARIEAAARALAGLEPGESWPTNGELGGNLTGTRDDEYRDGLREQARDMLAAADAMEDARAEDARLRGEVTPEELLADVINDSHVETRGRVWTGDLANRYARRALNALGRLAAPVDTLPNGEVACATCGTVSCDARGHVDPTGTSAFQQRIRRLQPPEMLG